MHPEAVQTTLGLACCAHHPRDLICLHLSFSFPVVEEWRWLVPVVKPELCRGFILWGCMHGMDVTHNCHGLPEVRIVTKGRGQRHPLRTRCL